MSDSGCNCGVADESPGVPLVGFVLLLLWGPGRRWARGEVRPGLVKIVVRSICTGASRGVSGSTRREVDGPVWVECHNGGSVPFPGRARPASGVALTSELVKVAAVL